MSLYALYVCLLHSRFIENHSIWILEDGPLISEVVLSQCDTSHTSQLWRGPSSARCSHVPPGSYYGLKQQVTVPLLFSFYVFGFTLIVLLNGGTYFATGCVSPVWYTTMIRHSSHAAHFSSSHRTNFAHRYSGHVS
jgi:hypothetical protein